MTRIFGASTSENEDHGLPRLLVIAFIVLISVLAGRLGAGHIAELDALVAQAAAADESAAVSKPSSPARPRVLEKHDVTRNATSHRLNQ